VSNLSVQTDIEVGLRDAGYAVIPDVVPRDRLDAFNARLIAAYHQSPKFRGGGMISGHINCYPGEAARFAYDELERAGVGDAIRSLRPGLRNDVRATLNFNLPGSHAQHYHMDGVYAQEFIICNVPVVDTDLANGAMDVLPGTHTRFYPFWRYAVERKYRLSRRLSVRRGDVLVRRSTLWHRGMPNRSDAPRPMLSFTLGEESAPQGDPFDAGEDIVFYPNWYAGGGFGNVWRERVEVAFPATRSALRFVKSLTPRRGYTSH